MGIESYGVRCDRCHGREDVPCGKAIGDVFRMTRWRTHLPDGQAYAPAGQAAVVGLGESGGVEFTTGHLCGPCEESFWRWWRREGTSP
jgi:hypothetical protein